MAEMVLAPSRGDGKEENFIQKFGRAFVRGDAFTKLSLLVWGLGYIGHGQLIKALLVTLVQGLGLYFLGTSGIPALKKFGTLLKTRSTITITRLLFCCSASLRW